MPSVFAPLENEPAYVTAARRLERRIVEEGLVPGNILPSENALASELGVNRSTVREAIRMLEQHGLVRREVGRKKLRVSAPRSKEIINRMASAMMVERVSFEELYEAMLVLEPITAANAASRHGQDDILALQENLTKTREALDDRETLIGLDIEFHELVAVAGNNRAISLAHKPFGELFYPAFYPVMMRLNVGDRLLKAHESIVTAIESHDVQTARGWMQKHIEDFRRGYELADLDIGVMVQDSVFRKHMRV